MRFVWLVCAILLLILLPFFLWEEPMNAFSAQLLAQRGAWWLPPAIAALLAADVFLPIPSSIVSTASGATLGFLAGALTNLAGMTLGCWLGHRAGRAASAAADPALPALWSRYGDWTLVLTRAVPVLAEAAVLFAGMSRMPLRRFLLLTTLANTGIAILYAAVGAFAMAWNSFLAAFAGSLLVPAAAQAIMRRQWRK
jgi:uncharacterized membrane protein YdjX (TVP38/TMEM64 family)